MGEHLELDLKARHMPHPDHNELIFFRAPYNNIVHTFKSSYDQTPEEMGPGIAVIRIDPDKTFVYLSEARESREPGDLEKTRTPMRVYLDELIPMIKGGMAQYALPKISASLKRELEENEGAVHRFFEVVV